MNYVSVEKEQRNAAQAFFPSFFEPQKGQRLQLWPVVRQEAIFLKEIRKIIGYCEDMILKVRSFLRFHDFLGKF